ncbi:EKC/KEOPS complex subunit LAGE3-like [Myotis myotis]|uniref:EKC/KEOPS complex subunit LAGE3-like n=1 Tax=Myotis myotis TaxID=51298 RepID=UPI00174C1367|nr:EKC/KEOPS complex subunit LAGE3-like [Myotis myotis]
MDINGLIHCGIRLGGGVEGGARRTRVRQTRPSPEASAGVAGLAARAGRARQPAELGALRDPSARRGGDAVLAAQAPGNRPHTFSLRVPFPSSSEADIARGSLAPDPEPRGGAVGRELAVRGSALAVSWAAEDPGLLRASVVSFLSQLSLGVRTLQRFGPPVFPLSPGWEEGLMLPAA